MKDSNHVHSRASSSVEGAVSMTLCVRQKYHGRAGERCRVPMPPEFEPSTDERHLALGRVVVPPCRIRPRRDKADHQRSALAFLIGFLHPLADCPTIGRVHPAFAVPRLRQPVIVAGVVARAFGVRRRGAHVEFQRAMQGVHPVEEVLRSRPIIGRTREVDGRCRTRRWTQQSPGGSWFSIHDFFPPSPWDRLAFAESIRAFAVA